MFQYSTEEVLGQNIKLLMPEPFRSSHDDYLAHYVASAKVGDPKIRLAVGQTRKLMAMRKDNSTFPIELSVSEVQTAASRGTRLFAGVVRNATEREALLESLRVARDKADEKASELEKADQFKDEFLANTSHELRTPLHAIIGITETALSDTASLDLPATRMQLRDDLSLILSSAWQQLSLVNDILDFARIRSGCSVFYTSCRHSESWQFWPTTL